MVQYRYHYDPMMKITISQSVEKSRPFAFTCIFIYCMMPFLIEPYNAWDKTPKKKKHWHELVEEEQLMARIIAEQQAAQQQIQNTAMAAAGAGGVPTYDYFNQSSNDPYDGVLIFVGSSLTITNQEILDVYEGSIDQSGQSWKEIHGHNCSNLINLDCNSNQLTSLDVSSNTALTDLNCYNNQLTTLNVSGSTALTDLNCTYNQLTSLDVSSNTALTNLNCYDNQLTSLDVSSNTALTYLNCYDNQLTSLDVSSNTALTNLDCNTNQLTQVSVDQILISLDTNGQENGYVDLTGDNNAAPSATGLAAQAFLEGKGWTVIVNN